MNDLLPDAFTWDFFVHVNVFFCVLGEDLVDVAIMFSHDFYHLHQLASLQRSPELVLSNALLHYVVE